MKLTVRLADVTRERTTLIELMQRSLSPDADTARFTWLYERGPFGPPVVWVACDESLGAVVGMAAAFHRFLLVGTRQVEGYVLGDFCIDPGYRSLGPALKLQQTCLESVRGFQLGLVYDFPSASMAAVYRRLGGTTMEGFVRLAKPLRADRKLAGKVRPRWAAKFFAAAVNVTLEIRDISKRRRGPSRIAPQEQPCGREFSELAQRTAREERISVARTAEYLNWRFHAHPSRKHRMLAARLGGELTGYIIYFQDGNDATIVDLLARSGTGVGEELLAHVVRELRLKRVNTVSASLLAAGPERAIFEHMGFRVRESTPAALFGSDALSCASKPDAKPSWFLMDGDRES